MTTGRRTAVAVLAWVLVVAGCSALVWFAISRAGAEVTGEVSAPALSDDPATPAGTPSVSSTGSGSHTTSPPDRPSTTDRPTTTDRPSTSTTTAEPSEPPEPSEPSDPSGGSQGGAVQRSRTVAGGSVTVSCQGSAISLIGASPAQGWSVQTKREPDRVEVEFEVTRADGEGGDDGGGGGGGGGDKVRVRATCAGGTPAFTD